MERYDPKTNSYMPYKVPDDWNCKSYSNDMDEIISCARCGVKLPYGNAYTSFQIHTSMGAGYGVCWNCHQQEREEEKQNPTSTEPTAQNNVEHPNHYQGKHECIDVMRALFGDNAVMMFCKCNAFKYRFRADKKNGAEDIAKAEWYEDYLIKMQNEKKKEVW